MASEIYGPVSRQKKDDFSNVFLVTIKASSGLDDVSVIARLPEEIQMQLASEWDTPFLQSGGTGILEVAAQTLGGVSTKTQFASAQVWSGSSPIELTLPLEFYAQENATRDVVQPIVALAEMALPRTSNRGEGGLFTPPGPRVFAKFGKLQGDTNITVQIGSFLTFKRVIITTVNPTFVTRDMTQDGAPLRATCEVTFRSMFTLTGDQLRENFNGLARRTR